MNNENNTIHAETDGITGSQDFLAKKIGLFRLYVGNWVVIWLPEWPNSCGFGDYMTLKFPGQKVFVWWMGQVILKSNNII